MLTLDPHASELTDALKDIAVEIADTLRDKYAGKDNAILAAKICEGYARRGVKITRHELCPMVNWLREHGYQIGTHARRGYYWIETEEEKQETLDNLRGRIAGMNRAITGLEGVAV